MLEIFYGTDSGRVRTEGMAALKAVAGGVSITVLDEDSYEAGAVRDAAGATSLFGDTLYVLVDASKGGEDFLAEVRDVAPAMSASENHFVLLLDKLLAADKKNFTPHASKVEEYKKTSERLDVFALANALAAKDKKRIWLLYQELSRAGVPAEELIGILWWQLKTLRLVAATSSPEEAGIKPYSYNTAERALQNFTSEELFKLSESLLTIYHQGHRGEVPLDDALELWCLRL